jgi:hypothetical protein
VRVDAIRKAWAPLWVVPMFQRSSYELVRLPGLHQLRPAGSFFFGGTAGDDTVIGSQTRQGVMEPFVNSFRDWNKTAKATVFTVVHPEVGDSRSQSTNGKIVVYFLKFPFSEGGRQCVQNGYHARQGSAALARSQRHGVCSI